MVLSTGLHGIEGYVGAAVLELFIDEFIHRLSPNVQSLLLIHAINPWGMANRRRVNNVNVDLNRNFVSEKNQFDLGFNREYDDLHGFLNPAEPVHGWLRENLNFYLRLLSVITRKGVSHVEPATLRGQYRHPLGIYYGGSQWQDETRLVRDLLFDLAAEPDQVLFLDMHTGYGPRYQMSIVNSRHDPLDSKSYRQRFDYPLVVAANPDEFYSMRGDMIDYLTRQFQMRFPRKAFYGAAFEFGTLGESISASLRSLQAVIMENRLYHFGAVNSAARRQVEARFEALFNPHEKTWRRKAIQDARRAFGGILRAGGILSGPLP